MVEWRLGSQVNHDKLRIKDVKFYSDAAKKKPADVSSYIQPAGNNGPMNWYLRVKDGVHLPSEITLYYDLIFDDGDAFEVDWDPTLRIKPRP